RDRRERRSPSGPPPAPASARQGSRTGPGRRDGWSSFVSLLPCGRFAPAASIYAPAPDDASFRCATLSGSATLAFGAISIIRCDVDFLLETASAMSGERVERRLAAILAADIAGYSRLMGKDEEGTLSALRAIRRELGDPKIAEHRGRI